MKEKSGGTKSGGGCLFIIYRFQNIKLRFEENFGRHDSFWMVLIKNTTNKSEKDSNKRFRIKNERSHIYTIKFCIYSLFVIMHALKDNCAGKMNIFSELYSVISPFSYIVSLNII